jgi:hypothetical protein
MKTNDMFCELFDKELKTVCIGKGFMCFNEMHFELENELYLDLARFMSNLNQEILI